MVYNRDRNVLLLCLDSVRKDFFDRYATRLTERATVNFSQCRAASGWSVPSHGSMLTGKLPHEHGIHVYNESFEQLDRRDTFLGEMPNHRAVGASANVYASDAFGFDGVFNEFRSVSPDRRFPSGMDVERWGQQCEKTGWRRYVAFLRDAMDHEHPSASLANGIAVELKHRFAAANVPTPFDDGARLVDGELRELIEDGSEPIFGFANFMDAHGPFDHVWWYDNSLYDVPRKWSSAAYGTHRLNVEGVTEQNRHHFEFTREIYGAAVDYLDRTVAELVDWVRANTERETTVVVTADHGENLGFSADRELLAHKGVLTEGLLHVPLLVINPPKGWEKIDETEYVSHLSLGDLLVGLADGTVPDVIRSRIPAERIGSNMADNATEAERAEWDRMIRVVYEERRKHEWDSEGGSVQYRLNPERPNWQERLDEAAAIDRLEPEFFAKPLDEYKRCARETAASVDVDETTEERLSDLGYL